MKKAQDQKQEADTLFGKATRKNTEADSLLKQAHEEKDAAGQTHGRR